MKFRKENGIPIYSNCTLLAEVAFNPTEADILQICNENYTFEKLLQLFKHCNHEQMIKELEENMTFNQILKVCRFNVTFNNVRDIIETTKTDNAVIKFFNILELVFNSNGKVLDDSELAKLKADYSEVISTTIKSIATKADPD